MTNRIEQHKIEHLQLIDSDATGVAFAGVISASTSVDSTVCRFSGTSGKVVQSTSVVIDDSNNITLPSGSTVDGVDISDFYSWYIIVSSFY